MSNLWQRVCFCRAHAARARCCHLPQEAALEWKMGFGQYADEPQYLTALLSCQVLCYFWINKKEKNNRWTVILFWFANNGFHLWNYLHGCSERLPQNLTDYKWVCTRNALTYLAHSGLRVWTCQSRNCEVPLLTSLQRTLNSQLKLLKYLPTCLIFCETKYLLKP